ncbi:MAG: hypothetical protein LBC51_11275 [Treponema sp.]|nr:hypothetical protein [Treponema sp.]
MAAAKDRLPAAREGLPAMADDWISVCTARQTIWNIPCSALTEGSSFCS